MNGRPPVASSVRDTLARSRSYRQLDPCAQQEVAENLEKTIRFLQEAGAPPELARGLAVGEAANAAADVTKKLVRDVNFPDFVKGLIQGVFTSIVESSVHQMQEYAKFLESVVKSVDQFARDEVHPEEARDYLTSKYPKALQKTRTEDGESKLEIKPDVEEKDMPDFGAQFNLGESPDLGDKDGEAKLVGAAQREIAKQRQQLLATMVLLGINRIIVTDGEIRASVVFDVQSHERATSEREAGNAKDSRDTSYKYDYQYERNRNFWGTTTGGSGTGSGSTNMTVSTEHASSKSTSEATLDAKARLSGSVLVKFRSETFPLERMTSPMELAGVQGKAQK